MKKQFMRAISLILLGSILWSCTACGGNNAASDDGGEESRDSVFYGLTGDPDSLDPAKTTDQMSRAVWNQIYDTIARRMPDGTYENHIAESWEIAEDGLSVTIKLKEGIKFHDGSELTAEDVAFSYNRLTTEPRSRGNMTGMTENGTTVVDTYTVNVALDFAYGGIMDVLAVEGRIVPKAYFEEVGAEEFAQHPIGCGPYMFVSRSTGEKIELTRFDDYYGEAPAIKDVTFRIITDSSTAIAALEKGELDFLSHAPLTAKMSIQDNEELSWYETPIRGLVYLCFRIDSEIFQNTTLRKAIQMGIDKEAMVIGGVEGNGEPISTMIPESCTAAPQDFPDVAYDLEGAKELLAEAGYPDGLTVTLYTQENATYMKPTQVMQGQLANMGITAEIETLERTAFFEGQNSGTWDIWVSHWTVPTGDADFLYQLAHSSMIGTSNNATHVQDPALDEALERGRLSSDLDDRVAAYTDACQIIQDNAYWVPLYTFAAPCAADKDLKGVTADGLYSYFVSDWSW